MKINDLNKLLDEGKAEEASAVKADKEVEKKADEECADEYKDVEATEIKEDATSEIKKKADDEESSDVDVEAVEDAAPKAEEHLADEELEKDHAEEAEDVGSVVVTEDMIQGLDEDASEYEKMKWLDENDFEPCLENVQALDELFGWGKTPEEKAAAKEAKLKKKAEKKAAKEAAHLESAKEKFTKRAQKAAVADAVGKVVSPWIQTSDGNKPNPKYERIVNMVTPKVSGKISAAVNKIKNAASVDDVKSEYRSLVDSFAEDVNDALDQYEEKGKYSAASIGANALSNFASGLKEDASDEIEKKAEDEEEARDDVDAVEDKEPKAEEHLADEELEKDHAEEAEDVGSVEIKEGSVTEDNLEVNPEAAKAEEKFKDGDAEPIKPEDDTELEVDEILDGGKSDDVLPVDDEKKEEDTKDEEEDELTESLDSILDFLKNDSLDEGLLFGRRKKKKPAQPSADNASDDITGGTAKGGNTNISGMTNFGIGTKVNMSGADAGQDIGPKKDDKKDDITGGTAKGGDTNMTNMAEGLFFKKKKSKDITGSTAITKGVDLDGGKTEGKIVAGNADASQDVNLKNKKDNLFGGTAKGGDTKIANHTSKRYTYR